MNATSPITEIPLRTAMLRLCSGYPFFDGRTKTPSLRGSH